MGNLLSLKLWCHQRKEKLISISVFSMKSGEENTLSKSMANTFDCYAHYSSMQ